MLRGSFVNLELGHVDLLAFFGRVFTLISQDQHSFIVSEGRRHGRSRVGYRLDIRGFVDLLVARPRLVGEHGPVDLFVLLTFVGQVH